MAVDPIPLFVASSVVEGFGVTLTLFRVVFRLRIGRFWWEDVWAVVVFVCGTTFIIVQFICFETGDSETALITSYLTSNAFTSTVWAVRMSLLYSTIRVISPPSVLRKCAHIIAVLFFLVWAILIALKIWWCVLNTKSIPTYGSNRPICALPRVITLLEVIADCISDAVLIALTLKLFWRIKLPPRQRRMILSLFSSSAIMSMISLFHASCQLIPLEAIENVAFNLEIASTLIICNLLVVVTYLYRVILNPPNTGLPTPASDSKSKSVLEDDDFTTPTSQHLTTVDLDYSTTTAGATNGYLTSGVLASVYANSSAN